MKSYLRAIIVSLLSVQASMAVEPALMNCAIAVQPERSPKGIGREVGVGAGGVSKVFQIDNPTLEPDTGFRYAFIEVLKNSLGRFSVLVKNDEASISIAIDALVRNLLKNANLTDRRRAALVGEALDRYRSLKRKGKKGWYNFSNDTGPVELPYRSEEIAFYHFVGDVEINAKIMVAGVSPEAVQLSLVQEPKLLKESFGSEWSGVLGRHGLQMSPPGTILRIPSRLVADNRESLQGLRNFLKWFMEERAVNINDVELAIDGGLGRLDTTIITALFDSSIHRKIGLPGAYQFFDKDFSMQVRMALEKYEGRIASKEDLQSFILGLESNETRSLFSRFRSSRGSELVAAVDAEFRRIKPFDSDIQSGTLKIRFTDKITNKDFLLGIEFHYSYRVLENGDWQIFLISGKGTPNDLFLTVEPDLTSSGPSPSEQEIKGWVESAKSSLEPILEAEKQRTRDLGTFESLPSPSI